MLLLSLGICNNYMNYSSMHGNKNRAIKHNIFDITMDEKLQKEN